MLKNKSVNGLRGLAALSVVINHFVAAFTSSILSHSYIDLFPKLINVSPLQHFFMHPFVSVFYNGQFAVIVFFCISGYVLALPYFEEEKNAQLI